MASLFFMTAMTQLILPEYKFKDDVDAQFVIEHTQEITDEFLAQCKAEREASTARAGEFHKVAALPTALVEHWMREGFNIYDKNVTAAQIVARLEQDNLTVFKTTDKRV